MDFSNLSQTLFDFFHRSLAHMPSILLGIVIFAVFFLLSRPVSEFVTKPLDRRQSSRLILTVIKRSISLIVILIGLYVLLSLAGLTEFAIALLSGTGVLGLIVGFAFKDIAENFLSSLLLSVQRPFNIGDIIEVSGYLGVVNKMTSRATTLVDFNGDHIQLPNSTIYKNAIRNLTANPNMRGVVNIGIGYDADPSEAQQIARKLMADFDAILEQPEPQVLVDSLGSATCNLKLYFWVNNEENSKLKVASVLMKRLVAAYTEADISMPDDARERIIMNSSGQEMVEVDQKPKPKRNEVKSSLIQEQEDTSSDNHEIRQQAAQSRDPEEGENIL